MLRSLLPSGVTLVTNCSGSIPGDSLESLTLITNELVTNAAKYAFAGRASGTVEIGYREEGAGLALMGAATTAQDCRPTTTRGKANHLGRNLCRSLPRGSVRTPTVKSTVGQRSRFSLAPTSSPRRVDYPAICGLRQQDKDSKPSAVKPPALACQPLFRGDLLPLAWVGQAFLLKPAGGLS